MVDLDSWYFDPDDGQLVKLSGGGEANCAVCGEPIMWCLDMFSFTTGVPHRLAHARCVWTPAAFADQAGRVVGRTEEE